MESKVTLIDATGAEIGETYSRRARQLVKQQRAMWADDTHTAIQFTPDHHEDWDLPPDTTPEPRTEKVPDELYALAERRIRDRRHMVIISILLIPGYFVIAMFWVMLTNGRMFDFGFMTMGIAWGMWTMYFIMRLRAFIKDNGYGSLAPKDWEIRRKIRLETEVDKLKRMGW